MPTLHFVNDFGFKFKSAGYFLATNASRQVKKPERYRPIFLATHIQRQFYIYICNSLQCNYQCIDIFLIARQSLHYQILIDQFNDKIH